jgi:phytoene dehydrogenase-like protein
VRDVVVIGDGHNGLVCGAYLAREALDVEVVEATGDVGGCIWSEDLRSGHRLERGAIGLSMVDDVVVGLSLHDHGLRLFGRETRDCFFNQISSQWSPAWQI